MDFKPMSRRRLLEMMGFGAAATTLAACQPEVVEKVVTKEVEKVVKEEVEIEKEVTRVVEKEAEQAPKEKITLRPSTYLGEPENYMPPRSEDFAKTHPNIEVEPVQYPRAEYTTKILTLAAAGQTPDIVWGAIYGGGYINLALKGIVIALDDLAASKGVDFYEEWIEAAIDVGSWEGKCYALPNMTHPGNVTTYYNKTAFDELGIDYLDLDTNIAELHEAATKLTIQERGQKRFGWVNGTGYVSLNPPMRAFGAEFLSEDGKEVLMDSPEGIACIEWMRDMMWEDNAIPTSADMEGIGSRKMFTAGNIAIMTTTLSYLAYADEVIGDEFEYDVTLLPKKEDVGVRGSCIACHHLGIGKDCEYLNETWDLLYWFCNHETGVLKVLNGWGDPGARHDCWTDPLITEHHPTYKDHYEVLVNCAQHRLPWNCHGPEAMDVIENELGAVWTNETTAEEGVKRCADSLRDVLDKAPVGA